MKVSAIGFTMVTTNWTETRDMEMIPVDKGTALRRTYQRSKIPPAKLHFTIVPHPHGIECLPVSPGSLRNVMMLMAVV